MDKTNEDNMFRGEIENTIKSINPYLPFNEAQYFIECIEKRFLSNSSKIKTPRITIVGSSVPEEIIYACGGIPLWILGGSFTMAAYADYAVPRDTDPISKSSLGFLLREQANDTVVIPLVNDSSRKLVYLLESAGIRVITIDIPPMKSNEDFPEYERQIKQCVKILGRRNKRLGFVTKLLLILNQRIILCRNQQRI